jgi:hypothetical protein
MTRVPVAAIAISLAFASVSCQKQTAKGPSAAAPQAIAPPQPFTLTLSSGGGFAGLYQGFTLTSAGEVRAWERRPGAAESPVWKAQGNPDSILAFARDLDKSLGVDLHGTGNMTTRILYALPDSTYQWSISGAGPSPDAPEPFRTWYARAEGYCRGLAPKP